MPLVTRKVSSCISCQWGGGPGVFGGIISSMAEIRLSGCSSDDDDLSLRLLYKELGRGTSILASFHYSKFNGPEIDDLACLGLHELNWDCWGRNDWRHFQDV